MRYSSDLLFAGNEHHTCVWGAAGGQRWTTVTSILVVVWITSANYISKLNCYYTYYQFFLEFQRTLQWQCLKIFWKLKLLLFYFIFLSANAYLKYYHYPHFFEHCNSNCWWNTNANASLRQCAIAKSNWIKNNKWFYYNEQCKCKMWTPSRHHWLYKELE